MNVIDFFGKEFLEEVTIEDIQLLVDNRVSESLYLDYKREMWGEYESSNK
jgi:hypothetical protein